MLRRYSYGICPKCGHESIVEASNSFGSVKYCTNVNKGICDYLEENIKEDIVYEKRE